MDKVKLLEILLKNKNKDFINRIINVNDFPTLENRDGTVSTHSMSYGESDGKYYVYPTVVYRDGKMQRLGPDTAWSVAFETGDYLVFDNEKDASDFSKEYKQFMPWFEAYKKDEPEPVWKDLNTGPGTLSQDSLSGVDDGN
jgi:hypothetical protein